MLARIAIDRIDPNPDQPRKVFDARAIEELADSIVATGRLIQPITVRPKGDGRYEIVFGERRWRAHRRITERGIEGYDTIQAHIRRMDEDERDVEAIVENMARADITPLEEARAFKRMLDKGWDTGTLARRLGIKQIWRIEERTRLLDLEPGILKLYETGNLSQEAASEISRVKDHAQQMRLLKLVSTGELRGFKAIRAAVDAMLAAKSQSDIFGEAAPRVSESDVEAVGHMEAKIEAVARMVAAGWRDGECRVATKVSPTRARLMADKLAAIQQALRIMERDLRTAAAEVAAVLV